MQGKSLYSIGLRTARSCFVAASDWGWPQSILLASPSIQEALAVPRRPGFKADKDLGIFQKVL